MQELKDLKQGNDSTTEEKNCTCLLELEAPKEGENSVTEAQTIVKSQLSVANEPDHLTSRDTSAPETHPMQTLKPAVVETSIETETEKQPVDEK